MQLTKAQLISLLTINDGDIEGLWNLNEDSGNAVDLSSNGYNLTQTAKDKCTGGTASASSVAGAQAAALAFDNNASTFWGPTDPWPGASWIKYDFGAGVAWAINKITVKQAVAGYVGKDFVVEGSNNDSTWTSLYTGQFANNNTVQTFIFGTLNTVAYRYIRITISTIWGAGTSIGVHEIEMMNSAGSSTSNDGLMGKARDFEADNSEYFTIADASCANLEISGSQTWFAWVKPESLVGTSYILGKAQVSTVGWVGYSLASTGVVAFNMDGLTTTSQISSDVTLEAGKWYFLCGVYDSANTKLKLWINGTKKEATASGNHQDSNGDMALGRLGAYGVGYYDGLIQNAGVLSVALSDAQVGLLYNAYRPNQSAFLFNLSGNWKNN